MARSAIQTALTPVTADEQRSAPPCASAKNPVDLVHLSRQSLGDRSLENEILRLFHSQSQLYLDRLECATTAEERKLAAHTVVGSARGLGAWKVAQEAELVERACSRPCDVSALRAAVEEANAYIEALLSD
ncbi:MAG: Hpt domain-containing protein [Rhizobiaceae bacterium]